ncbi:carbonic anhydrase [Desertihabitans brevis]|uniref:carbonic anhydrase n=1 Tax=Desertihabitans brevis TaxID=2268447 RepID=A0A367Z0C5_9ACTN|nr:carbonic anhydrase [Desertihabitans brevis]RCK71544.1 carbonic anhydrase [Desertihabitans brevis]
MAAPGDDTFDDLLEANRAYAERQDRTPLEGVARAGVAVVTCMDSRIDPLPMLGLERGDAKVIRTPGGRLTPDALVGCVLGVHLLGVTRILVVPHTRCAMASGTDDDLRARITERSGLDASDLAIGADPDQDARLADDLATLREHPLVAGRASVGGFLLDVDSGLLTRVA